jgi:hypothetical protein
MAREACSGPSPMIPRRRLLQIGALGGFGLSLANPAVAAAPAGKIRSCILIFFYGGPSQFETWDPKPDAPAEIRGEFKPIETSAPGVRISEHLPLTAKVMHRMAIIRSMTHPMKNHNAAAVEALCGRTPLGGDQELLADDALAFPCYGSVLDYARRDGSRGDLASVALPHVMYNVVRLPGQTSGFLGSRYQPYQVQSDPNTPNFSPGELDVPASFAARLENREALLRSVDGQLDRSERLLNQRPAPVPYQRAFSLLRSEPVRRAFRIQSEEDRTRERYGRNTLGQSLLLARRLVEAGVSFITVFDKIHNGQEANWDSHEKVFVRSREALLPPADRGLSGLIEDLEARGLLESTLVIGCAEFGRTPKINASAGRDHWPDCYSIVLAGGGVRGGTVHGASDETGAYPALDPTTPGDLAATLFWRFGVDPTQEMRDGTNRPYPLADGKPLRGLFSG